MAELGFEGVTKVFDGGTVAVDSVDLTIGDGEFVVFVGPSGSGKTTQLRMTAGLEDVSEGEISIGGDVVNRLHPMDRDIAMVFQSYALYPHMSVYDNMAFGLKLHKQPKAEIKERVGRSARTLGIGDLLKRKPAQLSGGQRQRVAMGRAIVREPAAFLMDEPLSNLDAKLRVQMRAEIQKLQHRLRTTTLYVTHDQTEAMTMGDRVAVMRGGRVVQVDTPQALYDRPIDVFVAGFIGSPAMNLIRARLRRAGSGFAADFGSTTLELPERCLPQSALGHVGRDVILGVRPEHLYDPALGEREGCPMLTAELSLAEPVGAEVIAHFDLDVPPVATRDTAELARDSGADELGGEERATLVARLDPRTALAVGRDVTLVVDPQRVYLFDPETEQAIH
jgi:multiple sugar transport system ATP-binding protein